MIGKEHALSLMEDTVMVEEQGGMRTLVGQRGLKMYNAYEMGWR